MHRCDNPNRIRKNCNTKMKEKKEAKENNDKITAEDQDEQNWKISALKIQTLSSSICASRMYSEYI